VREYVPLLTAVADPVVRAHYLQRLSRLAQVSEADLSFAARSRPRRPAPFEAGGAGASAPAAGDPREEFLLALLLRYTQLRSEGLEVPEDLLWESENRAVLSAWRESEELEAVKAGLPLELHAYVERLTQRRIPSFDLKEAREALRDCLRLLEQRRLRAEKQAASALLAAREEETGPSALVEAMGVNDESDELREMVGLQVRDLEAGLRLHGRERRSGENAVEARTDG
jgi:hypothetical protein